MPEYRLSVVSDRTTFSIPLDAVDDEGVFAEAKTLVRKARVPVGASVKIIRSDRTEMDVSEAMSAQLDQPGF